MHHREPDPPEEIDWTPYVMTAIKAMWAVVLVLIVAWLAVMVIIK